METLSLQKRRSLVGNEHDQPIFRSSREHPGLKEGTRHTHVYVNVCAWRYVEYKYSTGLNSNPRYQSLWLSFWLERNQCGVMRTKGGLCHWRSMFEVVVDDV